VKADDPELAAELENLGSYYREEGRDTEAEPMLLRALAIEQKALQRLGPSQIREQNLGTPLSALADVYPGAPRIDRARVDKMVRSICRGC
jgi:hypothetical protein